MADRPDLFERTMLHNIECRERDQRIAVKGRDKLGAMYNAGAMYEAERALETYRAVVYREFEPVNSGGEVDADEEQAVGAG